MIPLEEAVKLLNDSDEVVTIHGRKYITEDFYLQIIKHISDGSIMERIDAICESAVIRFDNSLKSTEKKAKTTLSEIKKNTIGKYESARDWEISNLKQLIVADLSKQIIALRDDVVYKTFEKVQKEFFESGKYKVGEGDE